MKELKMDEMLELDDDALEMTTGGASGGNNCPYCGYNLNVKGVYSDGLCPCCKRSVVSRSGTTQLHFLNLRK